MSFASRLRETGYHLLTKVDGDEFALPDGLTTIQGVFSTQPYIDPPFSIANDIREKACLEVIRRKNKAAVSALSLNDQITDKDGNNWKMILHEDNPAVFTTRYWLVKVVPGEDEE